MDYYKYEIPLTDNDLVLELIGINDEHLKYLKTLFNCDIGYRDSCFYFYGADEESFNEFKSLIDKLVERILHKLPISNEDIARSLKKTGGFQSSAFHHIVAYTFNGKPIMAKTANQQKLLAAIDKYDLVFTIGPAGTGKTYLAVVKAVQALKNGEVKKIVLTRPAVEAGESLGFLPGDLKEKVDPYLMPLYDALSEMLGQQQFMKLLERNVIEISPLAFMRGRTLNDAFIILDEAQNTTNSQMLMFLTRLGKNAKMLVNGDITQIDLPVKKSESGLLHAAKRLKDIKEIAFVYLEADDVVRNPLVQRIIEAYQD